MAIIAIAIICIVLLIASVRQEKRKFANVGLLLLASGFTACSIEQISGDGWLYTYFLSYLFLLFSISSVVLSIVCFAAAKEMYDRQYPKSIVAMHVGVGILAWLLISFFYYNAGGPLFTGVWDAIVHLPLMISVYFVLSFAALVIYTFLSHIVPTSTRWDYVLIADKLTTTGHMTTRLRLRLDLVRRLCQNARGRTRIILPEIETAITARDYLSDRGIESDDVIALNADDDSLRAKIDALTDEPCSVKPYHVGLIVTDNYLACRTAHELRTIGLRGTVLGCPTAPGTWSIEILSEYRSMIWAHSRAVAVIAVFWLILCALTLHL